MILVTTVGKVGSEAARLLAKREVPVRVRDPEKAKALADTGAEIAVGDLAVPASIDEAMAGVTSVVLVSPAVPSQELNVVASAVRAGVGHVVKATSKASADSPIPAAAGRPRSRPGLAASGVPHTLLRSNAYMHNDIAAVLSKLLGRAVTYRELTFDQDKDTMIRAGVPSRSPR